MNSPQTQNKWAPHDFGMSLPPRQNLRSKVMMAIPKVVPFGGWWAGFAGIFAAGGACPCCAAPVCANSGMGIGVLSALLAWCAVKVRRRWAR